MVYLDVRAFGFVVKSSFGAFIRSSHLLPRSYVAYSQTISVALLGMHAEISAKSPRFLARKDANGMRIRDRSKRG